MVQAIKVRDFQALQLQGAGFPKGKKGKTTFIKKATYACETQPSTHPLCPVFLFFGFYHKGKNREGPGMRIARKESPRNED